MERWRRCGGSVLPAAAFAGVVWLMSMTAAQAAISVGARPHCQDASSDLMYFPQGTFGKSAERDEEARTYYAKVLRAMSEPSLTCKGSEADVYRLLWVRSKHHPIAVRLEVRDGAAHLTATELDGPGGGKVLRRVEKMLSPADWKQISNTVRDIDFWNIPAEIANQIPSRGAEGAQWLLEGRKGPRYHFVDRWSPKPSAYRDLCLRLLELAGFPTVLGSGKGDPVY